MIEQKIHTLASTLRALNSRHIITLEEGRKNQAMQIEIVRKDIEQKIADLQQKQLRKTAVQA